MCFSNAKKAPSEKSVINMQTPMKHFHNAEAAREVLNSGTDAVEQKSVTVSPQDLQTYLQGRGIQSATTVVIFHKGYMRVTTARQTRQKYDTDHGRLCQQHLRTSNHTLANGLPQYLPSAPECENKMRQRCKNTHTQNFKAELNQPTHTDSAPATMKAKPTEPRLQKRSCRAAPE